MKQDWTDIVDEIDALKAERDALKAERDALRAALKPFAREANEWPDDIKDDWRICKSKATPITVGNLRAARAAINQDNA